MLEALRNAIFGRQPTNVLTPLEFGTLICDNKSQIIEDFVQRVRIEIPKLNAETHKFLVDHLPMVIDQMTDFLKTNGNNKEYLHSVWLADQHGAQRAQSELFTIEDLRVEYSILRSLILSLVRPRITLSMRTYNLFGEIFGMTLSHSTEVFLRNSVSEHVNFKNEKQQFADNLSVANDERTRAENERSWFEETMNRLPKPLFLVDCDAGRISFTNKAAQEMLGLNYAHQDRLAIYDDIITVYTPDGQKVDANNLPSSRVIRGEDVRGEEFLLKTPSGKFHIKIYTEKLPKAFGQPESAMILFQDITALKKIENSLREAETDLSQAIEIAQVGFWYVDVATNKVYLTPLLLEQFGRDPTETNVTLEQATSNIHPDDIDRVKTAISNSMHGGQPYHIEYRVTQTNGGVKWIEAKGATNYDRQGKPLRFTGTTLDITERVIGREILEASERELRVLADSMPQNVWSAKPDGELDYFNEVWLEYSGSTHEQNLGNGWTQFVHPDDMAETQRRWTHSLATHELYENEFRLRNKDGIYRWHMVRAVPVFKDGVVVKWYGTNTDIHDRIRLAKQLSDAKLSAERASSAKSQFLANMSHEIRTPLGAIMGFASLLRESGGLNAEQNSYASVIDRNSRQLLRIIDDILDLSKVEAGMMTIENIEFNLPEMLVDISSLMGLKAREKGISFNFRPVTKLPKFINTDPTRLRQILLNVIGNAVKFTERGMVEIRTSFSDSTLEFEVEDTGRGITDEQREHLFQPFAQADASTTRQFGGTGLGLALTRSLAGALAGSFELKRSELGKGSVFHIKIHATAHEESEYISQLADEIERHATNTASVLEGKKILVVEDSHDNQVLITVFLGPTGAQTEIASDGQEGCTKAFEKDYDLILMDVQMPVMDGITAVKRLRKKGYTKPVIALTAHAMKEERDRCLQAGFSDFLSKPVRKPDLIAAIVRNLT